MMGQDSCTDEALEDAKSTETKLAPEHWEETVEESSGPAKLRENEDDDLEDDEKAINDRPENARWLVWDST